LGIPRVAINDDWYYLRHILSELPQRTSDADISDLLPFNFAETATA